MTIYRELKQRNVIRMAVLYAVAAWLILQVAEVLIGLAGLPDWLGRAVLAVLAIGFPIVLILAWIFEITPKGIQLEKDVDRSESITQATGRRMDFIVIAIMAAAIILFAYDKWWLGPDPEVVPPPANSIAVLPFRNMSPDAEQEYFSDGIAEELLNLLSRIRELRVAARSSSFQFKGENIDIANVGMQLNVAHVLEGSVRKAGNRVRITAQLIDADTGYNLWSENFDRELDDIFAIQDEISQAIVAAMRDVLKLDASASLPLAKASSSTEAYDVYLLGQHLMHQRTTESIEAAAEHFQRAISIDSNYAPAFAGYAIASMLLMDSIGTYGDLSLDEAVARAVPAAERALRLDPDLAEAHAALGIVHYQKQEQEKALEQWNLALERNPNFAVVHSWRGTLLSRMGRYEDAFASTIAAAELDPLSVNVLNNYAGELFQRGQYEESGKVLQRMKVISPPTYYYQSSWQAYQRGEPAEALFLLMDGFDLDPADRHIPQGFANMFGLMGLYEESKRYAAHSIRWLPYMWAADFEEMLRIAREDHAASPDSRFLTARLGIALLASGDLEAAMPYLEEYVSQFDDGVGPYIRVAGFIGLYRQTIGDAEGAGVILNGIKSSYARQVSAGIDDDPMRRRRAFVALLEGRYDNALDTLDDLSRRSGVEPEVAAALRVLTALDDDARFDKILSDQTARWKTQRHKMLARVCGDETWAEWDPLPGTCKSFESGQ